MAAETPAGSIPVTAPVPQTPAGPVAVIAPVPHSPPRWRQGLVTVAILLVAAALGLAITGKWNVIVGERSAQSTDDAVLRADVTPLGTKSAGLVQRVLIEDFQSVKAGDLLVELRDDDFKAQVDLAEASVRAAKAALASLREQKELQNSRIAGARAGLAATAADLQRAKLERVREEQLLSTGATTNQKVELAVADHERFRATMVGRETEVDLQRKQVSVLDAQEAQLVADLAAREASLKVAQVNLDYTRIVAPEDGHLGEKKVRPGQFVSAGTQVVSLVGRKVWVIANYRETQMANVELGDDVEVAVDGVPGVVFKGRVAKISPATGSQFSLLPPDNATGNFTKIAQRIPVKIALDPDQPMYDRLRSGMSVVAKIHTGR
jgi:membrane fusion protein, multidrug efflux system